MTQDKGNLERKSGNPDINSEDIPIERHDTAAWADIHHIKEVSRVTMPGEMEVINAKEWVDSNEK
ncbi:CDIF630_02480 family spore surface protein [Clostridium polynesiense]|uniref:CDIF630_02480 family spore surface protein n=1 Tax=Clostridium polynesiense TaxID=1325933 RepID=UPI00058FA054|nr:DUF3787 domain-containing protein [Clostridium polynesiense]